MENNVDNFEKTDLEAEIEPIGELSLILPDSNGKPILSYPPEVVDSLRLLITRLSIDGPFPDKLALTSALRCEGVTFQAHALATTLAHDSGANVIVVDLNWWWSPFLPYLTGRNNGLSAVIKRQKKLDDVIISSGWSNLSFIPAGELDVLDRPKIARGNQLKQIIESLNHRYDHIILDVPAVLASSDSAPLLSLADGLCLVIRQGATNIEDVRSALDSISHLHIFGIIFNQVKLAMPKLLLNLIRFP